MDRVRKTFGLGLPELEFRWRSRDFQREKSRSKPRDFFLTSHQPQMRRGQVPSLLRRSILSKDCIDLVSVDVTHNLDLLICHPLYVGNRPANREGERHR